MAAAHLKAPEMYFVQRCRKIPYASRRHAMLAILALQRRGPSLVQHGHGVMNVYLCPICNKLHVGHRPADDQI